MFIELIRAPDPGSLVNILPTDVIPTFPEVINTETICMVEPNKDGVLVKFSFGMNRVYKISYDEMKRKLLTLRTLRG